MSVQESAKAASSKTANKQDTEFPKVSAVSEVVAESFDEALGDAFQIPEAAIRWSIRILALVIAVAIWHVLTEYDFNYIMDFGNVPEPDAVLVSFIQHIQTSEFFIHIAVSIKRILIGYGFATVFGILIGCLWALKTRGRLLRLLYRSTSPYSGCCMDTFGHLMWPTEESSIIFITFWGRSSQSSSIRL